MPSILQPDSPVGFPGGGAPADAGVPQANTDAIARRLLGDDLVNRYGDVIGARKPGAADALRDFTLAFRQGQGKVDELKLKIQEQYQDSYTKAQRTALAQKQADIDKGKAVLDAIKTVQSLPPGNRAGVLKETLDTMGIPYSGAAIKMFTDSDMVAQLPMAELESAVDSGDLDTATIGSVMGSGLNAAKFMETTAQKRRAQTQTGKLVLDAERAKLNAKTDRMKLEKEKLFGMQQRQLSIKNAQLDTKLKEKALAKPDKTGAQDPFAAIMAEISNAGSPPVEAPGMEASPESPAAAPALTVPPGGSDLDAVKQRLGLKLGANGAN